MNYLKTFLPYLFGNKRGKSLRNPLPERVIWPTLSFEEQLMFHTIDSTLNKFVAELSWDQLNDRDVFHLLNFHEFLNQHNLEFLTERFSEDLKLLKEALQPSCLQVFEVQELLDFPNDQLSLFAILKTDRSKKGRMLIRKKDGTFVQDQKGNIWSIPILGHTNRGLGFNHSNGQTPCGVYTVDGVMPEANNQKLFGEHRRLIVNFLQANSDAEEYRTFIPEGQYSYSWWKQSWIARELGRSLLRIHGSGIKHPNPLSPHFPMIPTSGCLATTETRLLGRKIGHQRLLLDTLMKAQGLDTTYENELKIHGILYVLEFDGSLSRLEFKV